MLKFFRCHRIKFFRIFRLDLVGQILCHQDNDPLASNLVVLLEHQLGRQMQVLHGLSPAMQWEVQVVTKIK